MSRLTELVRRVEQQNPALAQELAQEIKTLTARRSFGLNFERHLPESIELPERTIRRGDKVRFRAPRGSSDGDVDQRIWRVSRIEGRGKTRTAHLVEHFGSGQPERAERLTADLVVIAEFRDPIYPGLRSTGKVERGGNKPWHAVINGENYHALEALLFAYEGKVDCIYIDPPYNTRDKDWKYNNDYVDSDDLYRHSKWLAMMERRLLVAKRLLNPENSVLIATIDEKEYLRLGLLLGQAFQEARIQMVSSVINPKGTGRANEFSRVNEFIYFVWFGAAAIAPIEIEALEKPVPVEWQTFRRRDLASRRGTSKGGPSQFYPVYVNERTGHIEEIGEPLPHHVSRETAPTRNGCLAVFPVRPDGTEMNWALTAPSLVERLAKGYARAGKYTGEPQPYIVQYLKAGPIADIEEGRATVQGYANDGSVVAFYEGSTLRMPTTQWNYTSHSAEHGGTGVLKALLPGRGFPFPKSLYAVEDCLRFFVKNKSDAVIIDFFAGSGTTAHAVMRLNKQDGGSRRSIMVTNNEVSAEEEAVLRGQGFRPGDPEWEALGICDYITKPRIAAAVTGQTPGGQPIRGDYAFTDEFPMAEGFAENVEFFDLTYEDPERVRHDLAFTAIAPLLWMKAGSEGPRVETPNDAFAITETYAVLFNLDAAAEFARAVAEADTLRVAYIVTDDEKQYQIIADALPVRVQPVRLYEAYLRTFQVSGGED